MQGLSAISRHKHNVRGPPARTPQKRMVGDDESGTECKDRTLDGVGLLLSGLSGFYLLKQRQLLDGDQTRPLILSINRKILSRLILRSE